MLEEIRIADLGVIESATVRLGPGLTVVTGETGAGKTMLVTALGLLLGARADSGAVRTGARQTRVEGVVDVRALPGFAEAVEEAGGVVEDDRVLLARNVHVEGRSRAFVGGASVPVATLTGLAEPLVAVHGQSDQHRLLRPAAQRDALDRFGGANLAAAAEQYRELHGRLLRTEAELAELRASVRERLREAELLRIGLEEIAAVSPERGEDATLAREEARLGHADTLRTCAERARELLSGAESAPEGRPDALGLVAAARAELESVRDHDEAVGELADRVGEITYLLSDLAADVASYAAGVETDPARLAGVSQRRAALLGLTRKYGATVEEVLDWAAESAQRLRDLDHTDDRLSELEEQRQHLRTRLAEVASGLSAARSRAAGALAEQVTAELAHLAMPHARVEIAVSQAEVEAPQGLDGADGGVLLVEDRWWRMSASGLDEVEFRLASGPGTRPRALGRGASGGELSRVMLALEVALAESNPVPTFVFDEVDAGVGGEAAVEVGRRLALVARSAQVLVVTHLPQVAAYADHHVVVAKSDDGSISTSDLTRLDEAGRERELSRMLAGMSESDTARAHAKELLAVAGPSRALGSDR